ncbi:unnamed protein product [Spirodela intermedia]|uniref:Uncharacterized protein n=1 Tax=Spirodela intermedia TaxID=51605 RepID=A0A7I8KR09_SPIIN|nr:unnamed protein product [Spirodela intermedia]
MRREGSPRWPRLPAPAFPRSSGVRAVRGRPARGDPPRSRSALLPASPWRRRSPCPYPL